MSEMIFDIWIRHLETEVDDRKQRDEKAWLMANFYLTSEL